MQDSISPHNALLLQRSVEHQWRSKVVKPRLHAFPWNYLCDHLANFPAHGGRIESQNASFTIQAHHTKIKPVGATSWATGWRTHISRTDRHQQDSSYLIPNGSCQQRTPWAIVLVGQAQRVWVCLSQATATIYASKFVPKLSNRSGGFCHKDNGVVSATSWVGIWEISGQTREPRYETIPYRLVYSWF